MQRKKQSELMEKVEQTLALIVSAAASMLKLIAAICLEPLVFWWKFNRLPLVDSISLPPLSGLAVALFLYGTTVVGNRASVFDYFKMLSERVSPEIKLSDVLISLVPSILLVALVYHFASLFLSPLFRKRFVRIGIYALTAQVLCCFILLILIFALMALEFKGILSRNWSAYKNYVGYLIFIPFGSTICFWLFIAIRSRASWSRHEAFAVYVVGVISNAAAAAIVIIVPHLVYHLRTPPDQTPVPPKNMPTTEPAQSQPVVHPNGESRPILSTFPSTNS